MTNRNLKFRPRVFIGSSKESVGIAYAIQTNLENIAEISVWDQDIFALSEDNLKSLIKKIESYDAGIFVLAPDDKVSIRRKSYKVARDNVIFELGLFIGKHGIDKVFFVAPKVEQEMHIPTDLAGIIYAHYDNQRTDDNLIAALNPACQKIRRHLQKLKRHMGWQRFRSAIDELKSLLKNDQSYKRFQPHYVIGINHGGLIVGGLLYISFERSCHFSMIWTSDEQSLTGRNETEEKEIKLIAELMAKQYSNKIKILLVDDSYKSGKSMQVAQKRVNSVIDELNLKKRVIVKSAVIVYRKDLHHNKEYSPPDYYLNVQTDFLPYAPI